MTQIIAINLTARRAMLDDGQLLPITNLVDDYGEEVDDPLLASRFVCGMDNLWLWDAVANFENNPRH